MDAEKFGLSLTLCAEEQNARQQQLFRSHHWCTAQAQPLVTATSTPTQNLVETQQGEQEEEDNKDDDDEN